MENREGNNMQVHWKKMEEKLIEMWHEQKFLYNVNSKI